MISYQLAQAPNFHFTIEPEGYFYDIDIRSYHGLMYSTIRDIDGEVIAGNIRCCNAGVLIPFAGKNYEGAGNLVFIDENGQYPNGWNLGETCELRYYSKEELNGD